MANSVRDVIAEYESVVFKSTEGLIEDFDKNPIKDAIALLNKWLSITVADTSGKKAIGWEISDNVKGDENSTSSPFDPNFLREIEYSLPNYEEKNLWVRASPKIKALFEEFIGEHYWGYGNILHYNDILGKYIHMCVDIDINSMRVRGSESQCECEKQYERYKRGMPIFPVDVIEKGIPLSQAFLGKESDVVFINWFKSDEEYLTWNRDIATKSKVGVTNINFVFPNVGITPMPYRMGLSGFIAANNVCCGKGIIRNLDSEITKEIVNNISKKRECEKRDPYDQQEIPFALAYTLSMFILAADNYCKARKHKESQQTDSPLKLGRLSVAFIPVGGCKKKDNDSKAAYQTALLVTIKTPQTFNEYHNVINRLTELSRIIARPLQILESQLEGRYRENQLLRVAHTRTAIASIMSRNGSHNIGSHVLASLADNIGTMPDDKVLYQYIQHRMDYIATATTDFPTWRQPTMFLGTMIKNFLSQRHILDYIAGSEGLKGWRFQRRTLRNKMSTPIQNKGCIQFHIYPMMNQGGGMPTRGKDHINYLQNCMEGLSADVSLAIPGGTIGQHAFFTIIENIIRNAAKHDWSSPAEEKKEGKAKNLEVNIYYEDIPEEGNVRFTISTNVSDANRIDDKIKNAQPLIDRISKKFSAEFIDALGTLRRENWGIAEMKISAGYLQGREPGVIGGLKSTSQKALNDESRFGDEIIAPVEVEGGHLGYSFKVPKARTLLLVTNGSLPSPSDLRFLAADGIYVRTVKEVEDKDADNSFEFVLMDESLKNVNSLRLPFRVVYVDGNDKIDCVTKLLDALITKRISPKEVLDGVAAKRVKQLWRSDVPLNLLVAPFSSGTGGGQSLVNEAAATVFVIEEGFQSAVRSFNKLYPIKNQDEDVEMRNALDFFVGKASSVGASKDLKRSESKNYVTLIMTQLRAWLNGESELGFPAIRDYIENGRDLCRGHKFYIFLKYLSQVCYQAKEYLGLYAEQIATLPKGFEHKMTDKETFAPRLWEAANVVVCKDEDPDSVVTSAEFPAVGFVRHYDVAVDEQTISEYVSMPFDGARSAFKYIEPLSGSQSYLVQMQTLSVDDRIFQAKLIECALTRILIIDERVSKFVTNHSSNIMATFALMNIAVANDKAVDNTLNGDDEDASTDIQTSQVKKVETRDAMALFDAEGLVQLSVEDIKALKSDIAESNDAPTLFEKMEERNNIQSYFREKFDVLIVHQGILDKWFHGLVDDGNKMSLLLAALQRIFLQGVIITTGRGTPANIPDQARVLPFSTIETTLFRKYPEKLILVDAIMNILPIRKS